MLLCSNNFLCYDVHRITCAAPLSVPESGNYGVSACLRVAMRQINSESFLEIAGLAAASARMMLPHDSVDIALLPEPSTRPHTLA